MEVAIGTTSNISWDYLAGIVPFEYMTYIKQDCISSDRVLLYTAGEQGKAEIGYLLLMPCHYNSKIYELAHIQVVLDETEKHIGSTLLENVIDDLKINQIKQLCLSFEMEEDQDDSPEPFFIANGFEKDCSFSIQSFKMQQLLDSVVHKKAEQIHAKEHFKSYNELSRVEQNNLMYEKNVAINADNIENMHFMVINGEVAAMLGIYHMNDRIVLDDIVIFDHSKLKEIMLLAWSYFVEYVCDTYEQKQYAIAEIVVPNVSYEEGALMLMGEPDSKIIKQRMILNIE